MNDELANSVNIGTQLLRALGLENERAVSKIVITVEAANLVTVDVTREVLVPEMEKAMKVISNYKLEPKQ